MCIKLQTKKRKTIMSAVIEINGQPYDAFSGQPVGTPAAPVRRNIDGILAAEDAPAFLAAAADLAHVTPPLEQVVARPTLQDVVRPRPIALQAHQPQSASTLMRRTVHKPQPPLARHLKVHSALQPQETGASNPPLKIKLSVQNVSPNRLQRAQKAIKSPAVQRFPKRVTETFAVSAIQSPAAETAAIPKLSTGALNSAPKPGLETLLEQAIRHATSHEQAPLAKPRRISKKAAVLSVSFAAFLIMAGTAAGSNLANLNMYVAGAKAGFSAVLPSFRPAGYHMGSINYNSGVVASSFLSNSDQRSYILTEKPSNWDDQALLLNFVKQNAASYGTVATNGRTIYLYGDHQATWVWHGVWYQLQSNGSLSDHQLVQIAESL